MKLRKALYFIVSLIFTTGIALAQQGTPAPAPPPVPLGQPAPGAPPAPPLAFSMFFAGGSFIGVNVDDINKENMARFNLREARGVVVTEVVKDSPAEKAGLRKDDVILRFENDSVTSSRKLVRLVSEVAPDQTVRLLISRGGAEQEVSVTVGKRDNTFALDQNNFNFKQFENLDKLNLEKFKELYKMPGGQVWKWEGSGPDGFVFSLGGHRRIGVTTTELTKQLADYFGIVDGKGVLVTSVSDDSPAAKAGIKAGDVITAVDGEKVDGAGDLSRAINKKKDGSVTLTVVHNKNQRSVTVTPTEAKTPTPGAAPRVGRRIVIPSVDLGSIPATTIITPQINLPIIPRIEIQVPGGIRTPRVIRTGTNQPI